MNDPRFLASWMARAAGAVLLPPQHVRRPAVSRLRVLFREAVLLLEQLRLSPWQP